MCKAKLLCFKYSGRHTEQPQNWSQECFNVFNFYCDSIGNFWKPGEQGGTVLNIWVTPSHGHKVGIKRGGKREVARAVPVTPFTRVILLWRMPQEMTAITTQRQLLTTLRKWDAERAKVRPSSSNNLPCYFNTFFNLYSTRIWGLQALPLYLLVYPRPPCIIKPKYRNPFALTSSQIVLSTQRWECTL